MKCFAFFISLVAISFFANAQFDYGTPLIQGSVTLNVTETNEEYCDGMLKIKTETTESYATRLTGILNWDESDIELANEAAKDGSIWGTAVAMDNFTDTRKEGEAIDWSKAIQAPLFPVAVKVGIKGYGHNPCKDESECSAGYKAEVIHKVDLSGVAQHHNKPELRLVCSIEGLTNTSRFLVFGIYAASTWIEGGTWENSCIVGSSQTLTRKENTSECETYWKKNEFVFITSIQSDLETANISVSEEGQDGWHGSEGHFTHTYTPDPGVDDYSYREEIMLMRIDTAEFYRYLREKPTFQSFKMSGYYRYESTNGTTKIVKYVRVDAVLNLGKKPEFTLEGEDEQTFKDWVPGHVDYPDNFKPLSVKASFTESSDQMDTIKFEIIRVSRMPGICTNYPILPDKPGKEMADLIFAPQDEQTDPNIKILNDSTAITTKKVKKAVVVLQSRDFGACAQLIATAQSDGSKAENPYDGYKHLKIPYDMNRNYIADKWEDDMGIKDQGCNALDDKDNLPLGQGRDGDGLSVYEEYRGFICEDDVLASCDNGHTQRNGKHVRTSPLCRDVFIFDNDGLFSKYMADYNPSENHWHYVTKEQMKVVPKDQTISVITALQSDMPSSGDQSTEAAAIRTQLNAAAATMDGWIKKNYRLINANTPDTLRNIKQYGMHLLVSPVASLTGGVSIEYGSSSEVSPLKATQLVVLPMFSSFKSQLFSAMTSLMLGTKHPAIWDKYPLAVQEQMAQNVYEAMVPHEVGHGLGIPHHTKGSLTIITTKSNETIVITNGNSNMNLTADQGDANELCYADGQQYMITSIQAAFWAMGITECCMRYTTERETDFQEMEVLKSSMKYCRKGQTFTDANGNTVPVDDCFSKILIRCID